MRSLLLAAACLVLAASCLAQTADTDQATNDDVQKYFAITRSHDMMQKTLAAMTKPLHQLAHEQCQKDKDRLPADCEARVDKLLEDMFNQMPMDEMLQAMVPAYAKHFTKGDIDALIAFYSGPTGQKVLREMPAIVADSMQAAMPIMRKAIEKMHAREQQEFAGMMNESGKKPGAISAIN